MKYLCITTALALLTSVTSAQAALGPVDGAVLPPLDLERVQVGDAAPDFTLERSDT